MRRSDPVRVLPASSWQKEQAKHACEQDDFNYNHPVGFGTEESRQRQHKDALGVNTNNDFIEHSQRDCSKQKQLDEFHQVVYIGGSDGFEPAFFG